MTREQTRLINDLNNSSLEDTQPSRPYTQIKSSENPTVPQTKFLKWKLRHAVQDAATLETTNFAILGGDIILTATSIAGNKPEFAVSVSLISLGVGLLNTFVAMPLNNHRIRNLENEITEKNNNTNT